MSKNVYIWIKPDTHDETISIIKFNYKDTAACWHINRLKKSYSACDTAYRYVRSHISTITRQVLSKFVT